MADPTGRIRKLKAGDPITDGWLGQIVDRLNKNPQYRGNVTKRNGSITARNQYPYFQMLVTGDLETVAGEKWLSATCKIWSWDITNENSFLSSDEIEERVYFPFISSLATVIPWTAPSGLEDPANDNWDTVVSFSPESLINCYVDFETGKLVSPVRTVSTILTVRPTEDVSPGETKTYNVYDETLTATGRQIEAIWSWATPSTSMVEGTDCFATRIPGWNKWVILGVDCDGLEPPPGGPLGDPPIAVGTYTIT